ncbi:hypothetical protein [Chitinimonas sp. JJ19]|uniref:hypothetical protein n=1 Tax=Chitinimonas sp. JJ19 TaxID=3109352 RepID=UPI003001B472
MMEPAPKLKVSFKLFVLNVFGSVLAAFGVVGLQGEGAQIHPVLAQKELAWACLLIGLALMSWFMVDIFKRIRALQAARHNK